jgi:hypothetical protein
MILSRVFMSWFAIAAGLVSTPPESTLLVRSLIEALISLSSVLGVLLPALAASRLRLSALEGSWA